MKRKRRPTLAALAVAIDAVVAMNRGNGVCCCMQSQYLASIYAESKRTWVWKCFC